MFKRFKHLAAKGMRLIRERKFKYFFMLCVKGCKILSSRVIHARYYLHDKAEIFAQMKQDPRFSMNDQVMNFLFDFPPVERYEVVNIRLGDMRRLQAGEIVPLSETPEYRLIAYNDEECYRKHVANHWFDGVANAKAGIDWDVAHFRQTIASITNEGYDNNKLAIIVNNENIILDGVHRSSILFYTFGPDYEIPVVKVWQSVNAYSFIN